MGPNLSGIDPALLGGLVVVLILAGLVLGIILMYISSVMRFVLFDSVLAKECHIRQNFNRRQGAGWRYFFWQVVYLLLTLAGLAILVGIPAGAAFALGWFTDPKAHMVPLVLCGLALLPVLVIFFLTVSVIFVLTKDFVVPQMALEGIGAFEGWRRLWPMIGREKGGYAGYIGMKIVMAIGAGIVIGIATIILGLIIAIPTVGLSIIAIVTGKSAGLAWNVYTITLAVVVGSILLAAFLYLLALISVPVIVFFPAYSIYFFAGRYPRLNAAIYPPSLPPQSPPVASSPFEPPLMPPSPEPAG
jgi:hypothetical protein